MIKSFFIVWKKLVLTLLCISLFFSCSKKVEHRSLSNSLEDIDSLIAQSDYEAACNELSALEEKSYSHWDFLSIYRRYKLIGENDKGKSVLLKGISKNKENLELTAVLVKHFLNEGNINSALDYGKTLQGTKYGSIYSEAVFKDTLNKISKKNLSEVFQNLSFFPVFYDCYVGTENQDWLVNCALLCLSNGLYEKAASLRPEDEASAKEPLFWSEVLFDARRFAESIIFSNQALNNLSGSDSFYGVEKSFRNQKKKFSVQILANSILSDSWISLMDHENAENIRRAFIQELTDSDGNIVLPFKNDEESNKILPYIFVNSAKWAFESGNYDECRRLLTFLCDNWPTFVPALALYADFAWKTSSSPKESESQLALRDVGITSVEQEKYDNRVKIPVEDAVFRIDEAMEISNDPLLFILSLEMHYRLDKLTTPKQKIAGLWQIMEKNIIKKNVYPNLLFDYFTVELLKNGQYEVALELWTNFICEKYNKDSNDAFWPFVVNNMEKFSYDEVEFLSYFAASEKKEAEALALLEFAVFEHSEEDGKHFVSPGVSESAAINLAMFYNCIGRKNDSIELYNFISGKLSDMKVKSMIIYRMAKIFYENGDMKNAKKASEYALDLDKGNAKALLLKSKIKYE